LYPIFKGIELRVRGIAAIALGKIHDEEAIEPLIKVLENKR
jgi:HEAT repeat protein